MQVTGNQFTRTSAIFGNDLATLPDFPAEIRAPAGTRPGVSGFQLQFSSSDIHTPGDAPDVLVAMNPAALMVNIKTLKKGGVIVVNSDAFREIDLKKAKCDTNPLGGRNPRRLPRDRSGDQHAGQPRPSPTRRSPTRTSSAARTSTRSG